MFHLFTPDYSHLTNSGPALNSYGGADCKNGNCRRPCCYYPNLRCCGADLPCCPPPPKPLPCCNPVPTYCCYLTPPCLR
ncbi:unnamed protein product [Gongylonema pulchrum]|uniref:GRANULINS domain-containing protein n=1 Tax=Gongylonema pulchrum TaxID=637853 RepID=A0A183E869_9BILA|nr:unnamed protein product [Gongylonema pulchrum]